jgi:hypothetical protein
VDPEQVTAPPTAVPPAGITVKIKVDAVRLEQFTGTLKVALMMGALKATSPVPGRGTAEVTKMGVVSGTLIVSRPQPAMETARSVNADKNHVL